ncbi:MAG: sn-glycerol-1-phosphate dehydrogenase, partial [Bacteroidales bacterium]|nr:sn-glycerol-1-phosphate dehydrogenase [Bacteroidales bacterium]
MTEIEEALKRARDTKALEFGEGAMLKVPDMFKELFPGETAIVVADVNTYKAAGETVYNALVSSGVTVHPPFIFDDP